MQENLSRMGREENIVFRERMIAANSHKALLLAEAAIDAGSGNFEILNEGLFRAYFCEGRNIGDAEVLLEIAREAGVPREASERAWSDPVYEERLAEDRELADRIGISGIPTFLFGDALVVEGAVPVDFLARAAREASSPRRD